MTTPASAFSNSTAQRLEPITTGAQPEVVGPHLAEVLHDPRWRDGQVALISGGKSNLTYRVASDAGEVVLRRPPLGHVLPTAHDMAREYRVQSALAGSGVPVPRTLYLAGADSVLGAPFYLMERVVGHVCRDALPAGYADSRDERAAIGDALVATLARLHVIDPAQAAWPTSAARRASWNASCAAGPGSGTAPRPPTCPPWTRCATSWPARSRRPARRPSCTATSASTTRCCTRPGPARSWPCSTGS